MRRLTYLAAGLALLALSTSPATAQSKRVYSAQLSGRNEVPARETRATGHVNFRLSRDGTELTYRLVVANIENVTGAHIHMGTRTENGPVVVTLYGPVAPGGGRKSGVLATGTIRSSDLVGTLAGQPLSALIAEFDRANAYVNVHTDDGAAGSGRSGDFPEGEIRGQIH